MRIKINKPWFRQKGRYADGRKKVVIEWNESGKVKSVSMPKPECILAWINGLDGGKKVSEEKPDGIY